jgi:hypothetical protein
VAVAGSDPRHRPIVINHSSNTLFETAWMRALRMGDVLAQDVYTRKPIPSGRRRYANPFAAGPLGPGLFVQSALAHRFGREFWITELQAEPWERVPLIELDAAEISSISPERIEANLRVAARPRPERIYLWGAEWWRMQQLRGDCRYWELVRGLVRAEPD